MRKKAQAWGMDLIIAIVIFSVGLLVFIVFVVNNNFQENENIYEMKAEADFIMNNLLSEGYPIFWNMTNVNKIGIVDANNKINQTKLEMFYNLSVTNYSLTKKLFDIPDEDYFLYFDNMTINSIPINGIGKENTSISNISSNNLIKTSRISIYKDRPITIYLYVWE